MFVSFASFSLFSSSGGQRLGFHRDGFGPALPLDVHHNDAGRYARDLINGAGPLRRHVRHVIQILVSCSAVVRNSRFLNPLHNYTHVRARRRILLYVYLFPLYYVNVDFHI